MNKMAARAKNIKTKNWMTAPSVSLDQLELNEWHVACVSLHQKSYNE